jgi:hypothetical protein
MMASMTLRIQSPRQPGSGRRGASWSTPRGVLGGDVCRVSFTSADVELRALVERGDGRGHRGAPALAGEVKVREARALDYRQPRLTIGAGADAGGRTP